MIALLRFLAAREVEVKLFLGGPDRAVDALQHWALLRAAPVGAGDAHQLEWTDLAGAGDVGALAEVDERPVLVCRRWRQGLARFFGPGLQVVKDLDLEGLPASLEEQPAFLERHFFAHEWMVGGDGSAHPGFDGGEVVGGQRARQEEVVVEAVVDRRSDSQLGFWKHANDSFSHDVRRGVAHGVDLGMSPGVEQLLDGTAHGRLEVLVSVGGLGGGRLAGHGGRCRCLTLVWSAHLHLRSAVWLVRGSRIGIS